MASSRLYPVGIQSFPLIRQEGYVYVDKTAYVHDMVSGGARFYFLSRPRRFGKSLLVSTLEAYFQGRRELFAGLAIDRLEPGVWPEHPVLRFDLSRFKCVDRQTLDQTFEALFAPLERTWGVDGRGQAPGNRLERLIRGAYERAGVPVVVLVDEYDAPLLTVMHQKGLLREFREVMREFYAPLKGLSDLLRFVFLTGVTRFSQLSIFSELNNLKNVSMLPAYAGVCGITQEELQEVLAPDVRRLGEALGMPASQAAGLLKARYDGYRFAKVSPDVYNPFSLVSALDAGDVLDYWFASGTPGALVEMIRSCPYSLESLDAGDVRAKASSFDAPTEGMATVVPFMYQSGYLTIKGYDPAFDTYRLGIPNQEVRQGLFETLLPGYSGLTSDLADALVEDLARAVRTGNVQRFFELLRSFFAGMEGRVAVRNERDFEQVLYLVLRLVGAYVRCEVSFAKGRADLVLEGDEAVFVVELKYSRAGASRTAQDAVAQVRERGYLTPFERGGKEVFAVGAVFDEKERTLTDWLVERA